MTIRDMEDAFEKKYQNKISKLNDELNDYKNTNSVLSDKNKVVKGEERKKTRTINIDASKRVSKIQQKKT